MAAPTARKRPPRARRAAKAKLDLAPPAPAPPARPLSPRIFPRQNPAGAVDPTGERRIVGMGWHPDIADKRDYSLDADAVAQQVSRIKSRYLGKSAAAPKQVDWRNVCPPVEDQGSLGSCTANAVVGLMEILMRRSGVAHVDLSRLFLYKVTRRLLSLTGDTGAYIRTTIKAATVFGVPPEDQWGYDIARFDQEPEAYLYAYADNFSSLNYARLDDYGLSGAKTLESVKRTLAAGFPVAFGFPVYSSLGDAADIAAPTSADTLVGGHAVVAVGYDDGHRADGKAVPSLLIRNSWGRSWGDAGYGWLPYSYVEDELAEDFWTVFKQSWIKESEFN